MWLLLGYTGANYEGTDLTHAAFFYTEEEAKAAKDKMLAAIKADVPAYVSPDYVEVALVRMSEIGNIQAIEQDFLYSQAREK